GVRVRYGKSQRRGAAVARLPWLRRSSKCSSAIVSARKPSGYLPGRGGKTVTSSSAMPQVAHFSRGIWYAFSDCCWTALPSPTSASMICDIRQRHCSTPRPSIPKVVSEMLGHASASITLDIYSHVIPDDAAAAMASLLYDRERV